MEKEISCKTCRYYPQCVEAKVFGVDTACYYWEEKESD